MSERKQRTPDQIIAETEAKLDRLLVKQAKKKALTDPALAPLVAELDELRIEIREARKGLGSGPQSFDARIVKHEKWIVKIEEERIIAHSHLSDAEERKAEIEAEITATVSSMVNTSKEISFGA